LDHVTGLTKYCLFYKFVVFCKAGDVIQNPVTTDGDPAIELVVNVISSPNTIKPESTATFSFVCINVCKICLFYKFVVFFKAGDLIQNPEAERDWLIAHGYQEDPNHMNDKTGVPILQSAILSNEVDVVRYLLAQPGIDVNMVRQNPSGDTHITPLSCAVHSDYRQRPSATMTTLLLAAPKIDVNKNAPLVAAAGFENPEVVKLLLDAPGIDVNCQSPKGTTPLQRAFLHGLDANVALLLSHPCLRQYQVVREDNARHQLHCVRWPPSKLERAQQPP